MLPELVRVFKEGIHEIVIAVAIGVLMWPVKKVKKAYEDATESIEVLRSELVNQRENHLTHIEAANEKQVEILSKMSDVLTDVRLDLRETLGRLSGNSQA
jgi:DNA anti-recombination protein RmuC